MVKRFKFGAIILVFGYWLLSTSLGIAAEKQNMGGWQLGSPYNQLYDVSELEYFRAWVVKVTEIVPMPGMSPGVALHVREGKASDSEIIVVHVCPTWFIKPHSIGLKPGDRVKIRGVWTEINGEDVFMAAKIKRGDHFVLKVRLTKDGKPFWTMDQEELAAEIAASQAEK